MAEKFPKDRYELPDSETYKPKNPYDVGRLSAERFLKSEYEKAGGDRPVAGIQVTEDQLIEIFREAVAAKVVENTEDEAFMKGFKDRIDIGYPAWKN